MTPEEKSLVYDAAAGIALLYMGPITLPDEYTDRLRLAMEQEDLDEIEHVTALMVGLIRVRDKDDAYRIVSAAWKKIWEVSDRIYKELYKDSFLGEGI